MFSWPRSLLSSFSSVSPGRSAQQVLSLCAANKTHQPFNLHLRGSPSTRQLARQKPRAGKRETEKEQRTGVSENNTAELNGDVNGRHVWFRGGTVCGRYLERCHSIENVFYIIKTLQLHLYSTIISISATKWIVACVSRKCAIFVYVNSRFFFKDLKHNMNFETSNHAWECDMNINCNDACLL